MTFRPPVLLHIAALGFALGISACSPSAGINTHQIDEGAVVKQVDKTSVAKQVGTVLAVQNAGTASANVTCPDNVDEKVGATLDCTLTDNGAKYGVVVTVTNVDKRQRQIRRQNRGQTLLNRMSSREPRRLGRTLISPTGFPQSRIRPLDSIDIRR